MDKHLLAILVCPLCKGSLFLAKPQKELICYTDRLAYSLKEGIPVMQADKARSLTKEECDSLMGA